MNPSLREQFERLALRLRAVPGAEVSVGLAVSLELPLVATNRINMPDVAERILAALDAPLPLGNDHHRVDVSVGVAVVQPAQDMRSAALVALADQALYQAKREGRNRVK